MAFTAQAIDKPSLSLQQEEEGVSFLEKLKQRSFRPGDTGHTEGKAKSLHYKGKGSRMEEGGNSSKATC